MSDDQTQKTIPNSRAVDPQDYLENVRNPDGTATGVHNFPNAPATPDFFDTLSTPILTKDVPLNPTHNTFLTAVVVSVDYRLAPMHHLLAAYEDAVEALHWIKSADDVWLRQFADVSKCFLMDTSAGGNISYHAGLRASTTVEKFAPLKIGGSNCTIRSLAGSRGLLLS
ncbi:hypothetical protein TIFTF001_020370 [Ficus carica]|uniref:Alpha/beta hydrolase fold-3 domain-containing protein n=1 Tax=Ficus carica TaxID=3494 RepID=A0AA88DB04_FICCA|nr:hypothetical protein TIFTF001_020370 [Ficus carica]